MELDRLAVRLPEPPRWRPMSHSLELNPRGVVPGWPVPAHLRWRPLPKTDDASNPQGGGQLPWFSASLATSTSCMPCSGLVILRVYECTTPPAKGRPARSAQDKTAALVRGGLTRCDRRPECEPRSQWIEGGSRGEPSDARDRCRARRTHRSTGTAAEMVIARAEAGEWTRCSSTSRCSAR